MKTLPALIAVMILVPYASAATENVKTTDKATAEVDRPLINEVKAFLNQNVSWLYDILFGSSKNKEKQVANHALP